MTFTFITRACDSDGAWKGQSIVTGMEDRASMFVPQIADGHPTSCIRQQCQEPNASATGPLIFAGSCHNLSVIDFTALQHEESRGRRHKT